MNRELSNLIGNTFSCTDAIRYFDNNPSHVVERFLVPETVDVQSLTNAVLRHCESKGYTIPKSTTARTGMFMLQGGHHHEKLITITITAIKTMPTSVTVADLKKTEPNIKVGL